MKKPLVDGHFAELFTLKWKNSKKNVLLLLLLLLLLLYLTALRKSNHALP